MDLDDLIIDANKFCEEYEFEQNEHGVYIYESSNKFSSINLPFILNIYMEWLIENQIVKKI